MTRRSKSEKITLSIALVIFIIYAITLIFPFVWLLINSFKGTQEFIVNVFGLPNVWNFSNYLAAFNLTIKGFNIAGMMLNSTLLVVVGTVLSLFSSSLAAYTISKYNFYGKKILYMIAISVILIPSVGTIPATYKLLQVTGLYNNYLGMFLMYSGGFGFSFILLYGYFQNISWSYAEAASIDGANAFTIFLKVMLPQATAALGALAIVQAIGLWNDYFTPYMYLPKYPTLAVGLEQITKQMTYEIDWPKLFAAMIISIIPIMTLFIVFQKTIMENMVAGGLKG